MKRLLISALALLAGLVGQSAGAASIYLDPDNAYGQVGDVFSFDLYMDFEVSTSGMGSVSIQYESAVLGNASFTYDPGFVVDTTYTPTFGAGVVGNIGFYDVYGVSGLHRIGTLSLEALAPSDMSPLAVLEEASFITADIYGDTISVDYSGAMVSIAAVPVPAAFWLMASGLGLLAGWRRRG
ncbi:MAG TPA: hypothetical protein ENK53_03940 [Thiotrichales bacterium]|nr:hypothetical protein [Thiotrichales bacterium]